MIYGWLIIKSRWIDDWKMMRKWLIDNLLFDDGLMNDWWLIDGWTMDD